MKKVFFSMAGIALVAGSALAFSTAKNNQPLPCSDSSVPAHCTEKTDNPDEACCFKDIPGIGTQYYKLLEE